MCWKVCIVSVGGCELNRVVGMSVCLLNMGIILCSVGVAPCSQRSIRLNKHSLTIFKT